MRKPDAQFNKVTDISPQFFIDNNLTGIILDIDNTVIGLDGKRLEGVNEWIKSLQESNIKLCIASNSKNREKISKFANEANMPFFLLSCKPLKRGLKKALKELNMAPENVAEIGDQLFTDVWGAKRMKMFSILTKPFTPERNCITRFKRKIEQRRLDKINKFSK
jgi:HAD superfamily phosphatase (TIGR01668 family)